MFAFGTQFFMNMVFNNPEWQFRTFDPDRDIATADSKTARILNATEPDLDAFQKRGGKLILYHGWSDAAIAPQNTIDYYRSVAAKMGGRQVEGFVRLYMVPGMEHCGGGAGPSNFDVDAAVEAWVEKGAAPAQIIATKYNSADPASGPVRTRPLCPFPRVANWTGSGSTDSAANFVCAVPK
jgi:feruloyl esterase